jgi:hypothetical protein
MTTLSRWERLQLAALRLREIQNEAARIYRTFPELDRRPKIMRSRVATKSIDERTTSVAIGSAKFH